MIRHLIAVALVGGTVALAPSSGRAEQPPQIMAGEPAGRNVVFVFDRNGKSGGVLQIETHQVGNPGAKLSIWIDHSPIRLFSRILTTSDCKYKDDGAQCRIAIGGSAYRRFATAFRRGRMAHIEVQNAAVMQMNNDISLIGFSRQFGPQS